MCGFPAARNDGAKSERDDTLRACNDSTPEV
jgi:hypothetical protein